MEVRNSATLQPAKWGRWCERRKRERGRKRKRRRTRRRRRPHLPSKARWDANEGAQQRDPLTCQVGQVTRATEARAAGSERGGGGGEHTCQVRQGVGGAQGALGPAASEPTAGASARRTRRVWATAAGTTAVGCAPLSGLSKQGRCCAAHGTRTMLLRRTAAYARGGMLLRRTAAYGARA